MPFVGNVDMKTLKITAAAVAAIIIILALALVVGIPSGFLTSAIQDRVEQETGYHLTVAGSTKISLWPTFNVSLSDLTLEDPTDREGARRIAIGTLQADMTLSSVWSGHPIVTELVVNKPVLYRPLLRERLRVAQPASKPAAASDSDTITIERVTISNGAIIFSNAHDQVERRIDGIAAIATIDTDRKVKFAGIARAGDHPLKFEVRATAPNPPLERHSIPLELTFEAPGLLSGPLSGKADVRLNGDIVMVNDLMGTLGDGAFTGWASVDVASKPLVKLDLDFQRLDVPVSKSSTPASAGWSDTPFSLIGLNYVDAQVRMSAEQVDIADAHFAPAAIDATLAGGVLKASVSNLGAYGGQASGELIIDATSGNPTYAMHCDLIDVHALPLLSNLADFDKLDGRMQAKIAARSTGTSQHAIMTNVGGTAFLIFQDGAIRGINVAQMIRQLTTSTLSGWQEQKEQATDLTQLSASFRIDRGQATTTDLNLVGPLAKVTGVGTIDLGTRMLGFRVEPQLVLTTEGQGRASDPVGFGIPVMISGPWTAPRIYPDMAGVLDNPDAAYAKLREMGKGLFGPNAGGLGGLLSGLSNLTGKGAGTGTPGQGSSSGSGFSDAGKDDSIGNLGQALGNLIQQGLGGVASNTTGGGHDRSIPSPEERAKTGPDAPAPAPATSPPQADAVPPPSQDSQPMNEVLRQLFNR
jgi:AsmA protein